MGTVYQRTSDNRWVGVAEIPNKDGKRKRKTVYGSTRKEVRIKLQEIEDSIRTNTFSTNNKTTVYALFKKWLEVQGPKKAITTYELYKLYVEKHIKDDLGNKKLINLNTIALDEYYNQKLKSLSPNTVLKLHKFIKMVLNYGVINHYISFNPAVYANPPKKEDTSYTIYNQNDFKKLFSIVSGTYDELPISLASIGGLRRGEVFGLRWCDIDFKNNAISIKETNVRMTSEHIKDPKNKYSIRTIVVPSILMDILKKYKPSNSDSSKDLVCNQYKPSYYSNRFKLHIIEKNHLKSIRFHDLRHYNATLMLMLGIEDKTAAERLGHGTTSTLKNIYQHVNTDMKKESIRKLNNAFDHFLE